jgi:hypothetical protein
MTDQRQTLELDFELESDEQGADLARAAAEIEASVTALPEVAGADTEVAGTARMIDAESAAAILLTVRYLITDASDIVESLDELVNRLKQLARDAGLTRLWVWLGRTKVDVNALTAENLQRLAADSTPADSGS